MYPYKFTNIHEFIQRVALDMVRYGYWHYVTGTIPSECDPAAVDAKLMAKYGVGGSKWARSRRKAKGLANVHYARHQDFFVMLATKGAHRWYEDEEWGNDALRRKYGRRIKDIRRSPLNRCGYTVSFKECSSTGRGHVAVRIHPEEYRALKAHLVQLALHRSVDAIGYEMRHFPFEPYAGIKQQRLAILKEVNAVRKRAGLELVEPEVLRQSRRVFKLIKPSGGLLAGAA